MKLTRLLEMAGLHFIAMYILMYSMVNSLDNVFSNLNQFYMAGIMTGSDVDDRDSVDALDV